MSSKALQLGVSFLCIRLLICSLLNTLSNIYLFYNNGTSDASGLASQGN